MTKDGNCGTYDSNNICVDSGKVTENRSIEIKSHCSGKTECTVLMKPIYFDNCNKRKGYTDVYSIDYYCEPGRILRKKKS